jgi:PKD repeat protein
MPNAGPIPLTVAFSYAASGVVDSVLWDFGDGTTSTAANPTHTYSAIDLYT